MRPNRVLLGSVVSEASQASHAAGIYTFWVAPTASKRDVESALALVYGVSVESVNTSLLKGKIRRKSRKKGGAPVNVELPKRKKAFVRLKSGVIPSPFSSSVKNI